MVTVLVHTDDYRGDHAADVTLAVGVPSNWTVVQLMELQETHKTHGTINACWIEIPAVAGHKEGA